MAENMQQALQMATTKFSVGYLADIFKWTKKDKCSATEGLQKLINKKQGAGWTDLQTATPTS
jgi:hypothetical protein